MVVSPTSRNQDRKERQERSDQTYGKSQKKNQVPSSRWVIGTLFSLLFTLVK